MLDEPSTVQVEEELGELPSRLRFNGLLFCLPNRARGRALRQVCALDHHLGKSRRFLGSAVSELAKSFGTLGIAFRIWLIRWDDIVIAITSLRLESSILATELHPHFHGQADPFAPVMMGKCFP
jgi:hypothetical protein